MIAHIVSFTWKSGTADEDIQRIDDAISGLEHQIPALRSLSHGRDLGIRSGNAQYGVTALIEGDDPSAYLDHPAHRAVAADVVAPHVASKSAVQFRLTDVN